ncbi:MAG: hypothetical protein ACI9FR_003251 [Cryomorphaceae bacterium]|jgi:hypothetical protein
MGVEINALKPMLCNNLGIEVQHILTWVSVNLCKPVDRELEAMHK